MLSISDEFKTAMKQPVKELQAYLTGDVDIRSEDDLISFKITCDSGMCKTAMRKLEAKYTGEHNLIGKWVHVGYGVKVSDGTFDYLDYGSFLITEITHSKDTGITSIVGYDKMISSMKEYSKLEIEYPITLLDYTELLCEACDLELGNKVFGKNYCPSNINNWEIGGYTIDYGVKEPYPARARLKTLISVPTDSLIYINTFSDLYNFVIRGYDKEGNFIKSFGGLSNESTIDTTGINKLSIGIYNIEEELETEGQTILDKIANGEIKPFICLNNEINKDYIPYNDINNWLINYELWENIEGITYRDILVQIAQVTGSTCIISNDDKVYFKVLTETGETLTYDNLFTLNLEPIYGEINSVVLSRTPQEDNIYMRDEKSIQVNGLTEFKIENNEIIDKDRDNAMTPIYEALKGISYYPFEVTTEGLGWFEIGDKIDIINDTGDVFNTALFSLSISIDGAIKETLKTVAETKTQTQYQYATTVAKRIKNTEIIVNKQEQYIEQLVTDMYNEEGIVNENFTKVYQDIDNIVNNVQTSGGNNLIKNSVMFAYDTSSIPTNWELGVTDSIIPSDFTEWESGDYSLETGEKLTSDTRIRVIDLIPVDSSTTYYAKTGLFNIAIREYDSNKTFINSIGGINSLNGATFTTSSNASYIAVSLYEASSYNEFKDAWDKIQPVAGVTGDLLIDSNTESLTAGCLSGHGFTLLDLIVRQKISVSSNSIYSFSTRIKKLATGTCYVKLYNSSEEHIIELLSGEEAFYKDYEIKSLSPKDNYYIIEFYGSADSEATFTDNMLALGEYKSQWTQANGEIMNTQVNVNLNGILVKSSIYLGDYTVMSPLEFAGYSNINGNITRVFSLNKDVTEVEKLLARKEIKMVPIKIVPVTDGDRQGWAFVPST